VERAKSPDAVEAGPELVALGDLLVLEKQFPEAEQNYDRAVKIFEKSSGIATPDLLPALDGIAAAYVELHHPAEAEAAWRRALSIRESAFGPSTLEVADTLDRLGRFYFQQKKYPEAAYCYERTLFIRSKAHGDDAPDTQATLTQVASVYGAQGRQADAEPLFRSMLSAKQVELASSVNSLAALLASHNRDAEAESLYKMSISVLDKHGFVTSRKPVVDRNDPPSPLLAETLDQYAALLKKMRKRSEAAKMEARARILHGIPEGKSGAARSLPGKRGQ
jgi:tetratricopeptide (TPR) repeat protein